MLVVSDLFVSQQEEDGEAVAEAAAQLSTPPAVSQHPASSGAEGMDVDAGTTISHAAAPSVSACDTIPTPGGVAVVAVATAEVTGKVYPLPLVTGLDLTNPFKLRSADDLKTPYTNYTSGYKALLDYVWFEPARLEVLSSVPMPSEEILAGFIPSPVFPSDHLAVSHSMIKIRGGALSDNMGLLGQGTLTSVHTPRQDNPCDSHTIQMC